jgi:predicted Zn finger-like uncharacterized protein
MSLITSCPSCGTMFRVVPDQLKISEGWVRCGHCSEVFDATAHLSDESVLVEPELAQQATRPTDLPTRPAPMETRPADMQTRPAAMETRPADLPARAVEAPARAAPPSARAASSTSESIEPSDFFGEDSHSPLEPSPLDAPFVFRPSEVTVGLRDSQLPGPGSESQMLPEDFEHHPDAEEDDVPNVSFVRQGRRKAFWRRPGVRIALAFSSLALAMLLLLQLAYQDRDRLALTQPSLRPVLEGLCGLMRCTISAPRQIEAVTIESSGFNRVRNDTYRLAFTLRNTAAVQVAVPAMELTITDSQDQAIARRVLTPAELGADNAVIPAAGEWSRSVGVLLAPTGAARVAGYRLLAFYP